MNETAVPQRAEHKDYNCKGMKQAEGFMLVFIRRSYVCVAPSVPSEAGLQEDPCVALYTYTYANARNQAASCLELPFPF